MIRNSLKENGAGENKGIRAKQTASANVQTPETARGILFWVNIFGMCEIEAEKMESLEMVSDALER